jgi:F5/8 type C domain
MFIPGLLSTLVAVTSLAACAETDGELGTAVAELAYNEARLEVEGSVTLSADLFSSFSDTRTVGGPCHDGTIKYTVQMWTDNPGTSNPALSWHWVPGSDHDCTAVISMTVSANRRDTFHWRVYSIPYNLTKGTTASQSSTLFGANAARAIDGNTDGNWNDNSVTHTDLQASPWWQVDLGVSHPIGTVLVNNRTDCCSDRLADFDVLVSADGTTWRAIGGITGPAPAQPQNVFLTSANGRFVRVQLRGTNYLSLAEVQVFVP